MSEMLIALAVVLGLDLAVRGISHLLMLWETKKKKPIEGVELSETDKEMVQVSRQALQDCFGDDVIGCFRNVDKLTRVNMVSDFARQLAETYGLDIRIDIRMDAEKAGIYSADRKVAEFNVGMLLLDSDHQYFAYFVEQSLTAIVHELRHAVQHEAIRNPGFWNVSDEVRMLWAKDMKNYIDPSVDVRKYAAQLIERDARTFADAVMEGAIQR